MIADTAWLLGELVALFSGVAFAIHLLQRRVGPDRLRTWMGGTPLASALKGIVVGFVTPFCTYSAIPVLVGLRQAAVTPAGCVAFIVAAPVLDPVLFGALVVITGPGAALVYSAVAFAAALSLALVAQRVGIDRHLKPIASVRQAEPAMAAVATVSGRAVGGGQPPPAGPCAATGADPAQPWRGLGRELGPAALAALRLLRSVAALIVAGLAIGLGIEATVSPDAVASITGDNGILSIPLAAALGTPLYVNTGLFVPIANSLGNAGVGIGAVVALTISGAGANVPELILLTRLAARRLVAALCAYVFAVAVGGGLIAHLLLG